MKKTMSMIMIVFLLTVLGICFSRCDDAKESSSPPMPPDAPATINATDGSFGNQVQITWDASERADTYKVYRAIDEEGAEFRLITSGVIANEWVDETVSEARFYYYSVIAVNRGGDSSMSESDLGYAGDLAPEPPTPPSRDSLYASQNYLHHVYVRWDEVYNADTYHVYRSNLPAGEYTRISPDGGVTAAELNTIDVDGDSGTTDDIYSYDDVNTAAEGKAYYYRISAENEDGEGAKSDVVSGWFPYDVPNNPPSTVEATDGTYSNKVVVLWTSVTEAESYSIYRSLDPASGDCSTLPTDYESLGSVSGLTYDDNSLSTEDVYCYAVKAVNSAGASDLSTPDKGNISAGGVAIPSAPLNVDATIDEENRITISWDRADAYAASYRVYRCTIATGNYGDSIGSVSDSGAASYSFSDTVSNGITTDTTYYYKVKAVNGDGESSFSAHARGMALPSVPPAPTVIASDGSDWDSITISWSEAARAATYTLYRSTNENGPWDATTMIANKLTSTSYVDNASSDVYLGGRYYYAVCGINTGGAGETGSDLGYLELPQVSLTCADGGWATYRVDLSWTFTGPTGIYYDLDYVREKYSSTSEDGPFEDIATYTSATLSVSHSPGAYHIRYRIRAVVSATGYEGPWTVTDDINNWVSWSDVTAP
ncbi:MAG TPA: hypothetical protein PK253_14595 [Spirochaetota bacterium]|nr:hypothetical protein [Spirochaetota bacterium]